MAGEHTGASPEQEKCEHEFSVVLSTGNGWTEYGCSKSCGESIKIRRDVEDQY